MWLVTTAFTGRHAVDATGYKVSGWAVYLLGFCAAGRLWRRGALGASYPITVEVKAIEGKESLRHVLESVRQIRARVHGTVDSSVIQELDRIIGILEELDEKYPKGYDPQTVLTLLGIVLQFIPVVADLLGHPR